MLHVACCTLETPLHRGGEPCCTVWNHVVPCCIGTPTSLGWGALCCTVWNMLYCVDRVPWYHVACCILLSRGPPTSGRFAILPFFQSCGIGIFRCVDLSRCVNF